MNKSIANNSSKKETIKGVIGAILTAVIILSISTYSLFPQTETENKPTEIMPKNNLPSVEIYLKK